MNDFTKKELEKLRYAITNYDYSDDDLNNKIQSLIDNYCEHEFTEWYAPIPEDRIHICMTCKRYI